MLTQKHTWTLVLRGNFERGLRLRPNRLLCHFQPKRKARLDRCDALSLQPLGPLLHFEFHQLAFIQRFITVHLNGRKMHEHILAGLPLDESVSFGRVEPLHHTLFSCQFWTPLFLGMPGAGRVPRIRCARLIPAGANRSPATQGRQAAGFYSKKSSPVQKMSSKRRLHPLPQLTSFDR